MAKSTITKEILAVLNSKDTDPSKTLLSGRIMAKAWAKQFNDEIRLHTVQYFMHCVISSYWNSSQIFSFVSFPLQPYNIELSYIELDESIIAVASVIGKAAAELDVITASYELGNLYTSILPEKLRSDNGVFYTPPALTDRLLNSVENAGVDWSTVSVADPACGGGAFLAPIAHRIISSIHFLSPEEQLQHLEHNLKGYEIDPFSAWLTEVFLQVAVKDVMSLAGRRIKSMVTICDTIAYFSDKKNHREFDVIIGNPPYGKLTLTKEIREEYEESLFGHANLYGLFTHLAIKLVKSDGIIGYLTPTSFLSGEYFKKLRMFIRKETNPLTIDFVAGRKGVFEDVLQETLLAVYKKKNKLSSENNEIEINEIHTLTNGKLKISSAGKYRLADDTSSPWILPRDIKHAKIVASMSNMKDNLITYGYRISTGQLVWNRHKEQLSDKRTRNSYPIIWAEAVSKDGTFQLKADKKNHKKWFQFKEANDFLLTTKPCVLLQRTTSKEQKKRLITTVLPDELFKEYTSAVIENHLNMIIPTSTNSKVSLELLSTFLNSKIVNDAFRTISGSVAVSAYELESLPLPKPSKLKRLQTLINENASPDLIEKECTKIYTKTNP
ncbi:adenine-specific DNA-methyltransferase [Chryseobacterium oranimense]|uniref:site-specific DNA-methyltransferase (adenine-specific) n=1 Tax=Chryseobacterium oranimense TaxID=421058 RepID=A0A1M5ULZ1_9FLAO|nr:Eco57I restriction-modification methylase domain-containing protein [Chryseobacterium oranimense]SHH64019.1 adenine-specific DNA-methyltransferase [Chryseobacterium oranimense]